MSWTVSAIAGLAIGAAIGSISLPMVYAIIARNDRKRREEER